MAFTGIILRRGSKDSLIQDPPRQGEIVFSTDTYELGMLLRNGNLHWQPFNYFDTYDQTKLDGIEEGANNYVLPSAGTELGGVKSGGDITVNSEGIVSVNNSSHEHEIEDIVNLNTVLDTKQDSLDNTNIKTINGNSILGAGNIDILTEETSTLLSFNNGILYYVNEEGNTYALDLNAAFVTSINGQSGDIVLDIDALIPDQTNKDGMVLGTDGTSTKWVNPLDGKYLIGSNQTHYDFISYNTQNKFYCIYNIEDLSVYVNGIKMVKGELHDYTALNGTSITFNSGLNFGDVVQVDTNLMGNIQEVYSRDEIDTLMTNNVQNVQTKLNEFEASINEIEEKVPQIETTKFIYKNDTQVLDSFNIDDIRSAEYLISASSREGYRTSKLVVMHDNKNPFMDMYSDLGTNFGPYTPIIDEGVFKLLFGPSVNDVTIEFIKSYISNIAIYDVVIPQDLMLGDTVIDLLNDSETIDLSGTLIPTDLMIGSGYIDLEQIDEGIIDLDPNLLPIDLNSGDTTSNYLDLHYDINIINDLDDQEIFPTDAENGEGYYDLASTRVNTIDLDPQVLPLDVQISEDQFFDLMSGFDIIDLDPQTLDEDLMAGSGYIDLNYGGDIIELDSQEYIPEDLSQGIVNYYDLNSIKINSIDLDPNIIPSDLLTGIVNYYDLLTGYNIIDLQT